MINSWLPSLIAAVIAAGMVWFFVDILLTAAAEYRERFQEKASSNLAAMFLFISGDRLFVIYTVTIVAVFLLTLIVTGNFTVALIIAAVVGMSWPLVLRFLRIRRIDQAVQQLPDTLAGMSSGMRAGQSLQQAVETVVAFEKGPLSQELTLFLRELRVGVGFNEALDNLHSHLPRVEVQLVVAAMKIARETGSNLAETLERIATTLRAKLQMEGKIRSLTAQGKLQGVVMAGLPVMMGLALTKMEPHAMSYLYTTWYGWLVMGGIFTLDLIGYLIIRKIVSIDV